MGGAAIGALLLSGLALAIDFADRGFRSPDDITRDLALPVLGHVPQLIAKKSNPVTAQIVGFGIQRIAVCAA